ncbi:MAG: hypothetical protein OXG34_15530, partial [bacterium]|nr:hypothetical protein [bacterium]
SKPGQHNDRWMVTYPRGLLGAYIGCTPLTTGAPALPAVPTAIAHQQGDNKNHPHDRKELADDVQRMDYCRHGLPFLPEHLSGK